MAVIGMKSQSGSRAALDEDQIIREFGELIKSKDKMKKEEIFSIISKLEGVISNNEVQLIKIFILNARTGIMRNTDDAPNISFRVDTLNTIFDSLQQSFNDNGVSDEKADEAFFEAGRKCGCNFGARFVQNYQTEHEEMNADDVIKEWCRFDSSVGWGRLEYDSSKKIISITNNFQTQRINGGDFPKNCSFFKGYILGVLSKILGTDKVKFLGKNPCEDCPKCSTKQKCNLKLKF